VDAQEKYEYWLESAQYDLDTADAMFASGRWFYVVFTCQQAIEKLVKGLYTLFVDDNVPRTHNISKLAQKFDSKLAEPIPEENYVYFDKLLAFYINGRYTSFKQSVSDRIGKHEAKSVLDKTKEVFAWLLTLKP
jgi:HEPN domain-containing protein